MTLFFAFVLGIMFVGLCWCALQIAKLKGSLNALDLKYMTELNLLKANKEAARIRKEFEEKS